MDRKRFISRIRQRLPLRLHMTLILTATSLAGVGGSKLLLLLGVHNVGLRYPLIVMLAYLVFLVLVRLWLYLIAEAPTERASGSNIDLDCADLPLPTFYADPAPAYAGGGGVFDGGGASDSFADAVDGVADAVPEGVKDAAGAVGDVVGGAVDDEGGLALVVVLGLVALLLSSVFGGALYLVWQAPAILSEAAFNTLLAASLVRSSRRMNEPDWVGSVFRTTWKPFALILVCALLAGVTMHHYFPQAHRLTELFATPHR